MSHRTTFPSLVLVALAAAANGCGGGSSEQTQGTGGDEDPSGWTTTATNTTGAGGEGAGTGTGGAATGGSGQGGIGGATGSGGATTGSGGATTTNSTGTGGSQAKILVVSPASATLTVVNDVIVVQGFTATLDGQDVTGMVSWGFDRPDIGITYPSGVFEPTGKVGGAGTLTAKLNQSEATAQVQVTIQKTLNSAGLSGAPAI
jgi:hypothetical protein